MARGKFLSDTEKTEIRVYKKCGLSNRAIASKIGRSEHLIRNYIKLGDRYGAPPNKNKRNTKITLRQRNQIKFEATTNKLNSTQIISKLDLPIKKCRVQQILRSDKNIKWKKPVKRPVLSCQHKVDRLRFARDHMHWQNEWRNVIFSDEKKFNLDGPDGLSSYWHDLRRKDPPRMSRNFGSGSLMVWAAFSYYGKLQLCFIDTKMTSEKYVELLEDVLITYLDENNDKQFIYQQDNASIHVSKHTKQFFLSSLVPLLEWPARSPDLNPMENLWGVLARRVYSNNRQYATVLELRQSVLEC